MIRLDDLRVFAAVHDYGGFQKAADVSGMTQSAVTKIVRKLETHYDVSLVERGSRGMLTPAGRALYDRAVELLNVAATIEHDMLSEKQAVTGTLRIGCVPALLQPIALPVLAKALRKSPNARFSLGVKLSSELISFVADGRLDLAVAFDVDRVPPDVIATTLGMQLYRLVTRSSGPLAGRNISREDLTRCEWLLPFKDIALRGALEKSLDLSGNERLNVRVETDTSATLFTSLILETDLIAIMAEQSYRRSAGSGLSHVQTTLPQLSGRVALYQRRKTPSTGLFADTRAALIAAASEYFSASS